MRPRYPPPVIVPALRSDIPDLIRIVLDAEGGNVLWFLQFPDPQQKIELAARMKEELERYWGSPALIVMKALDGETGQKAALAMWQLRGYTKKELENRAIQTETSSTFGNWEGEGDAMVSIQAVQHAHGKNKELGQYIQDSMDKFLTSWPSDTKHLYLALLMTDPKFQRRGIGSALLQWGAQLADQDRVPSFLIASPVGYPLYRSLGWQETGEGVRIQLREWFAGAEAGDKGLGVYKFYFMFRMPLTAGK